MRTPLHSRAAAGLREPRSRSFIAQPAPFVTLHWGGPSVWTGTIGSHDRCPSIWRGWQAYHMDAPSHRWTDIAYTSAVCPHGHRYEGRGPGVRTAAQGTSEGNQRSHAVVYLGGQSDPLTDAARWAFLDEIERLGGTRRSHSAWRSTDCPGNTLRAWVQAGCPAPGTPPEPAPQPSPQPLPPQHDDMRRRVMALPGLARGASGHYVKNLQGLLCNHAADLVRREAGTFDRFLDGQFGPNTQAVLEGWQRRVGGPLLGEVGKCGPATWAWLVGV